MVKNSDKSGNKTFTTAKYKMITKVLQDGLVRLMADQAYFKTLVNSNNTMLVRQGKTGFKATTEQMYLQQRAIVVDHTENVQAFQRGEIYKFW